MAEFQSARFTGDPILQDCLDGRHVMASPEQNDSVRTVQQALLDLGYVIEFGATGLYGVQTTAAVAQFQRDHQLQDDGKVGPLTMAALDAAFVPAPAPAGDPVQDLVDAKIAEIAGTGLDIGAQTGPPQPAGDELGAVVPFERGLIVVTPAQECCVLLDPIGAAWFEQGGPDSPLEYPTGDTGIEGDRLAQDFTFGGMAAVGGAVHTLDLALWGRWLQPAGGFDPGWPTSGTTPVAAVDQARFATFEQAVIVAHPETGAQLLQPEIFNGWLGQLAAGNPFGLPVDSGHPTGDGATVFGFTGGQLLRDSAGTVTALAPGEVPPPGSPLRFILAPDNARHLGSATPDNTVTAFVGGPDTLRAQALDIAKASGPRDFVYLLNWWCDVDLELIPGTPDSTLRSLLTKASAGTPDSDGAQVCAMFWRPPPPREKLKAALVLGPLFLLHQFATTINQKAAAAVNSLPNARAIVDSRHLAFGSHHQKVLIVGHGDSLVAWCGGIDPNADRLHPFGQNGSTTPGSPLFDVSVRIEGPAAADVLQTFLDRWSRHPDAAGLTPIGAAPVVATAPPGPHTVQISHTYGRGFPFTAPVQTARTVLENALVNARRYAYLTCQYFTGSEPLRATLRAALRRVEYAVVVMAPIDIVGDTPDAPFRRHEFITDLLGSLPSDVADRLLLFDGLGVPPAPTTPGAYVHSKLLLVDDEAAFVGTPNYNRRSWTHDSEILTTIVHNGPTGPPPLLPSFAEQLRIRLWSTHLGVDPAAVADITAAKALWLAPPPGARVRRYDPSVPIVRPSVLGVGVSGPNLDRFWNYVIDPQG
ncbi:hypothetical protein Cs7R123_07750 [Catellatospora sp. TT07R-123]|uniref:peptidoglycan-binding protein n=1 Tax=Catellatospora sp. TT07R-123 TaxID=2733863 RepID=UPI001B1C1D3D|nr:peptidoglycan-binding protein [Catellatospora sp. TT07R-123]GHJ43433.1 hypothetical protein Cs7R123_07750 [Catellatospora sp. TT07R-123]